MKNMKKLLRFGILLGVLSISLIVPRSIFPQEAKKKSAPESIQLPKPIFQSKTSVEEALRVRRSTRTYANEQLSISEISQILWAAQGITMTREKPPQQWLPKYEYPGGNRTAPSAGGLFPIEIYLLIGNVGGLSEGVYKYFPKDHSIKKVLDGNKIMDVYEVALKQSAISEARALLVITGVYERAEAKYGERGKRYTHIEVGAVCQNAALQGITLGIGSVVIGAFNDEPLKETLRMPSEEFPLAIMPLGKFSK